MSENFEKTFSLEDLKNWQRSGRNFAVVGDPVAHSLSPKMQNSAFEFAKKTRPELASAKYFKFQIAPEKLGNALEIFYKKGFEGLNLTLPHKIAALPFLKKISKNAEIIGAANTLFRDEICGGFCGENTDGNGFKFAAENALKRKIAGTPILLLGAGGAARAIAVAALQSNCEALFIKNRSREKAEILAKNLRKNFPSAKIEIVPEADFYCEKSEFFVPENSLVVNATSLGLKISDASPFPKNLLKSDFAVFDATYGNHVPALVADAISKKIPAADGREMLAWQGALAFEIWTRVPAENVFPTMFAAISK